MTRNRLRKLRRGVMVSLAGLAVSSTATAYAEETVPATAAPETTTVAPSAETVSEELLSEAKTQVDVAQGAVVTASAEVALAENNLAVAETAVNTAEAEVGGIDQEIATLTNVVETNYEEALATAQNAVVSAEATLTTATAEAQATATGVQEAETVLAQATADAEKYNTALATAGMTAEQATSTKETAEYVVGLTEKAIADAEAKISATGTTTEVVKTSSPAHEVDEAYRKYGNFMHNGAKTVEPVIFNGEETITLPATEGTYVPNLDNVERYFVEYVNEVRALNGLPTLEVTTPTEEFRNHSNFRANESMESGVLSHITTKSVTDGGHFTQEVGYNLVTKYSNSDKELAYKLALEWFTDYYNVDQYSVGHAYSLLVRNGSKYSLGMAESPTEDSALGGKLTYVFFHQFYDFDNEAERNNLNKNVVETKTADGKAVILVNGQQLKLFPKRTFQYVREVPVATSPETVANLEGLKRDLLNAKAQVNRANNALAILDSAKGYADAPARLEQAQANYDTAVKANAVASGKVSIAQKAVSTAKSEVTLLQGLNADREGVIAKLATLKETRATATTSLEKAKALVAPAQTAVSSAKAKLEKAKLALDEATNKYNALAVRANKPVEPVKSPIVVDQDGKDVVLTVVKNDKTTDAGIKVPTVEETKSGSAGTVTTTEDKKAEVVDTTVKTENKKAEVAPKVEDKKADVAGQVATDKKEAVVAGTEKPDHPVKFETQWVSTREVGATAVSASNPVATPTYSRVAARQALPATGSRASYLSLLAGLSSLTLAGLAWTRKRG